MKNFLRYSLWFALALTLFSCDKDEEEPTYSTRFHVYFWNVDTLPLTIPSTAFEQTFRLQDLEGRAGRIIGVPGMYAADQQDTLHIENTILKTFIFEDTGSTAYISSIKSDIIEGKWFTIINEEQNQLKIILDKNEETQPRVISLQIWTSGSPDAPDDGHPTCDQLTIYQQPAKSE